MRYVIEGPNGPGGAWIMSQLGRRAVAPYRAVLVIDSENTIRGGAVLNGFNGSNVDLTSWLPRGITRQGLRTLFEFIFVELKCQRVTARTRRGNYRATKMRGKPHHVGTPNPLAHWHDGKKAMLLRMGFQFECVALRWYGATKDDDALVFVMLRDDCPWLKGNEHGRTQGAGSGEDGRGASADEPRNGYHAGRAQQLQPGHALG